MLAADGSQTEVSVAVGGVSLTTISLTATYRYFLASSILTAVEYHAVPVLPLMPAQAGAAEARSLLQQPVSLQQAAAQVSWAVLWYGCGVHALLIPPHAWLAM